MSSRGPLTDIFVLVDGGCYFPVEVQGEYVTQSMIDSEIAYTSVTIAYNSIPGWCRAELLNYWQPII